MYQFHNELKEFESSEFESSDLRVCESFFHIEQIPNGILRVWIGFRLSMHSIAYTSVYKFSLPMTLVQFFSIYVLISQFAATAKTSIDTKNILWNWHLTWFYSSFKETYSFRWNLCKVNLFELYSTFQVI